MQTPKMANLYTWIYCLAGLWLLGGSCLCVAAETSPPGSSSGGANLHHDMAAGVSFQIPFTDYIVKTGRQVQALIEASPEAISLPGVTYTSGLYAHDGEDFLVIWTTPRPKDTLNFSRAAIRQASIRDSQVLLGDSRLRFDAQSLRGVARTAKLSGLQGRILVQVMRTQICYIGYYYARPEKLVRFNAIKNNLVVDAEQDLSLVDLPQDGLWETLQAAMQDGLSRVSRILVRWWDQEDATDVN